MTKNLLRRSRASRWTSLSIAAAAIVSAGALTVGCLERPVVKQKPNTSNVFVQNIANKAIDKIDLLFVIDNSTSMADKQAILEQAVPNMVQRLVVPDCVVRAEDGTVTGRGASTPSATPGADPDCATGDLEFKPVNDIHIGVISSSLGSHGTPNTCANAAGSNGDDKGYLMPRTPTRAGTGIPDPHGTGFLVWHPALKEGEPANTPVEANLTQLKDNFAAHVVAAGEKGCGFEAQLESWYRLLVDPSPPKDVSRNGGNIAASTGIDEALLEQRRAFLRPDSLVAIVLLTDENDCSAMDGGSYYPFAGYGWLLTNIQAGSTLRVATTACETNPNDPCCYSCLNTSVPSACKDESSFAACAQVNGAAPTLPAELDRANARCFQNQRRFGIDLLYPTSRYVSALKSTTIIDGQDGEEKDNPLFIGADANGKRVTRDPTFVFFAGITGVPWQDIATPDSLANADQLQYLTAEELSDPNVATPTGNVNRWALILGEPGKPAGSIDCRGDNPAADCGKAPVPPLDPFMIESINERDGTNPLTNISTTRAPAWNDVNGHEYNNAFDGGSGPANDDLQYSCIFPLAPYDAVKESCAADDPACDCGDEPSKERPLCKETPTSAAGTTQHFGKAYPATRVLQVLRDFGSNSIVASICPKVNENPDSPAYGFNPAVGAIVDRLAEKLGGQCLPRELTVDDKGLVECAVVEAFEGSLDCGAPGRVSLTAGDAEAKKRGEQLTLAVRKQLEVNGQCEGAACDGFNLCEIKQFEAGAGRQACLESPIGSEGSLEPGYCYVDPSKGLGSPQLVATCDPTEARLLRFVGQNTPVNNSITFVACAGDAAQQGAPAAAAGGAGN